MFTKLNVVILKDEEIRLIEKARLFPDNEYIIMSEVALNENVTQRELSRKLGVSVSTVNILMNKLIREGLIKMTQISQRQVLYMLTPVGMMEKAKKTINYLKVHYRVIYESKEKIKSILEKIDKQYDVIYILMSNDEMRELVLLALHEYISNNSKSNIKIINNIMDIYSKDFKSQALVYMTANEYFIRDLIKENDDIKKCDLINLAELI